MDKKFCIDADGSGGKLDECAMAIWNSIKTFQVARQIFHGEMTDSGGGVLHILQCKMAKLHHCAQIYFVAPCMVTCNELDFC
jgi:hypothetical protein